jgi:hypothetical protein
MMWQWVLGDICKTAVDNGLHDQDIEEFGESFVRTMDSGRLVAIGGGNGEPMWFTAYGGPMPNPYDLPGA